MRNTLIGTASLIAIGVVFSSDLDFDWGGKLEVEQRVIVSEEAILLEPVLRKSRKAEVVDPLLPVEPIFFMRSDAVGPFEDGAVEAIRSATTRRHFVEPQSAVALQVAEPQAALSVRTVAATRGAEASVGIELQSEGTANAMGMSLRFDPTQLTFVEATAGADAPPDWFFQVNGDAASQGILGIIAGRSVGEAMEPGVFEVLLLRFQVASDAAVGESAIGLTEDVTPLELVDREAMGLPAAFSDGGVDVQNALPTVELGVTDRTYVENASPILLAADASVSDDSDSQSGATLTVSFLSNATSFDRLGIEHQGSGSVEIGVSGPIVRFEGPRIGSFEGGEDGSAPLVVTLDRSVSILAVQALIRAVTYWNVSDAPDTAAREIAFAFVDGEGGASDVQSLVVDLDPINDPPTLDGISNRSIPRGSGTLTVGLSGISAGGGETQNLMVSASSSRPEVIPDPVVDYSAGGSTGSLRLEPAAGQGGIVDIFVSVRDTGLDQALGNTDDGITTQLFQVTVTPVAETPTGALSLEEEASRVIDEAVVVDPDAQSSRINRADRILSKDTDVPIEL